MVQTGRREVLDDTLVTEAVFDMSAEQIMRGADDPEGIQIGDAAAASTRRRLRQERRAARHPHGRPKAAGK